MTWLRQNWRMLAATVAAVIVAQSAYALVGPAAWVSQAAPATMADGLIRFRQLGTAVVAASGTAERLTDVAMNGAAGTRTNYIEVKGWSRLTLGMAFDYTAASDISVDCDGTFSSSPLGSAVYHNLAVLQSVSASGVGDYDPFSAKFDVSADVNHSVRLDVSGYWWVKCVYAATSAGGSDILDTDGSLSGL